MKKRNDTFLIGSAAFICAFLFSEKFLTGVKNGLLLSANAVVPSLFVFMCASSVIGSGEMPGLLKKVFNPVMRIFNLPAEAFTAVFLGFFAGYPTGAKITEELYLSGRISENQKKRMLRFCVNPGIGFSVNAVGIIMLNSKKSGIIILVSACLSSLLIGLFSSFGEKTKILFLRKSEQNDPMRRLLKAFHLERFQCLKSADSLLSFRDSAK